MAYIKMTEKLLEYVPKREGGQLGLKSSRPLSQVGPGSNRPGVFSERTCTYICYTVWVLHNLSD